MTSDGQAHDDTHRDTHAARYALEDAAFNIRRARDLLQDMHDQVSGASRALSDVDHRVRVEAIADSYAAMALVAAYSHHAADSGIGVATQLRNASEHIAAAQDHAGQIDTAAMSAPQAADIADLRARIDAYGQAVDLARPMATAASEHLYSAADLASRAEGVDPAAAERPISQDVASVATIARDLSRAQEGETHLDRTVELADDIGQRSLDNPQMAMSMAEEGQSAYNDHLLAMQDAGNDIRDRVEAEQIYQGQGDHRPLHELDRISRDASDGRYDVLESPREAGRRAAEEARARMAEQSRRAPAPTGDPGGPRVQGPRR
ncbi:MAG: hypothetical protein L0G89_00040 [Janibacter sp.]|nr:hypothetical protein [Janibacter sp.]